MHSHIHACIHTFIHAFIHVQKHGYIHGTWKYIHAFIRYIPYMHSYKYTNIDTYMDVNLRCKICGWVSRVCVSVHVWACMHMYVCMHLPVHAPVKVYIIILFDTLCMCTNTHTHTHYIYIYIYIYTLVDTPYSQTCMYIHAFIHLYSKTCMYTYIHTSIQTCIQISIDT
jgi:hypothetical protein